MSGFKVKQPGLLSLLQDGGRYGCHGIGLTCGGPLDPWAHRMANRLCDNEAGVTALEVSFGGLVLETEVETRLAVTGAEMPLKINGESQPLWCTHQVKPGDRIELAFAQRGTRSYLAVAGGFEVAPQFGSTATVVREGVGGLNGCALKPEDHLPCSKTSAQQGWCVPSSLIPHYQDETTLRMVLGYQQAAFSREQQQRFFHSEYQVTDRSDRMGFRLQGPAIESSLDGILSEGICHGAIQVPADGQPIVLMNDRQTIGGYPKLGSVIALDTARLAQLAPGARVRFEAISLEQAHNLNALASAWWQRLELDPLSSENLK
ncbi:biotin-dependent carboxyltransferase family protein [Aestuariirhabdus sp. Z084]|uniref:5-oxoprolinase subunit C family protein n=1 Tax=Aestuariirhabdus haliotis TaxID=2918751 RepID=UPI00201B4477|nr:biotin-dependent carboxyltransferase family protein [Aestuariirhabdus haliotis]MCL6417502.1 biotin-dependent carboxyltransferase family protein [Aestuariirhabdus haliotis]MCL6421454.1 biotin-dependent carboxyltransferase family protein [Aestuariirhabdus haliotis]